MGGGYFRKAIKAGLTDEKFLLVLFSPVIPKELLTDMASWGIEDVNDAVIEDVNEFVVDFHWGFNVHPETCVSGWVLTNNDTITVIRRGTASFIS